MYGGDLPLDIKDEYYEQLYDGHTPEEAAALVWKELQLSEEDLSVFRLVLADIQWKLGQMTEDTLRNALEVLDNGAAMAEWEGASESDRRSRQRVLDRLRKKLESPQGPLKTVKRPKPKKFKYKIGDVISVQLVPELVKGKPEIEYIVISISWCRPSDIQIIPPVVAAIQRLSSAGTLLYWIGREMPCPIWKRLGPRPCWT